MDSNNTFTLRNHVKLEINVVVCMYTTMQCHLIRQVKKLNSNCQLIPNAHKIV